MFMRWGDNRRGKREGLAKGHKKNKIMNIETIILMVVMVSSEGHYVITYQTLFT